MKLFKNLFNDEKKELSKFSKIADEIENLDDTYSKLSDEDLKSKTEEFKKRLENGETLEDILIEAFATVREAAFRVIKEKPFYVQLLGGLTIHYGNIAEMRTGEGKTLTSVLPAYLNALTGDGVHVITVNEYLAQRDAKWMGQIYEFLGLTVKANHRDLNPKEKKEAYEADITYTTNNELGFDYLRDNMVVKKDQRVLRGFNYAIIDEVDSVLIDEARTPLIISGGNIKTVNIHNEADTFVKSLKREEDYVYEEKTKSATMTEEGTKKAEKFFKVSNLYDIENTAIVHRLNQALKANYSLKKDFDYVVSEDQIFLIDQFTGRIMKGRAFSEGLQQAIQAKENVSIKEEVKTLATVTMQNFFRMYNKLAGMTGTAKTEEEEFRETYNMLVIEIPTNKPIARDDRNDILFVTKRAKYDAIVNEVKKVNETGQPILIGTIAVETSELISTLLKKKKIKHEVLNAKNHAREAEIIKKAGEMGSITIATNMAGRGTDIKLQEGVTKLGGLYVLGTERHESRRIDNQLRGRAGRQGDKGVSQFYVSMEDELMIRFGGEKIKSLLERLNFPEDRPIENKMFSRTVENAQKKIEGVNFDIRKLVVQYDDVINNQREIIYKKRNSILDKDSIREEVLIIFKEYVTSLVNGYIMPEGTLTKNDIKEITEIINENVLKNDIKESEIENKEPNEVIDYIYDCMNKEYLEKLKDIPEEIVKDFEKAITLRIVDTYWTEHINSMDHLKEGVGLRGYGGESPIRAYTMEGYELFNQLLLKINETAATYLIRAEIRQNTERKQVSKNMTTNDGKKRSKKEPKKVTKVGRNEPCPCGSGKKYKQCCGKN